jgi:hypothetical protein
MTGGERRVQKARSGKVGRGFAAVSPPLRAASVFAFYLLPCALYYQFIPCEPDEHFPLS